METALLLPVILLIVLAVVDFGRLLAASISVSNAAKTIAVYTSRIYDPYSGASLDCLNTQVQSMAKSEVIPGLYTPTVSLTTTSPAAPAYAGEQEIASTVTYSFTFITPFVNLLGRGHSYWLFSQAAAEPLTTLPLTGTTEPAPTGVTALRAQGFVTDTFDEIDWTPGAGTVVSQPFTVTVNGVTNTSVYTGGFTIFRSDPNAATPLPNGCPVGSQSMTTATGPYSTTIDSDPTISYTYWVAATPPHPSAYYDARLSAAVKTP